MAVPIEVTEEVLSGLKDKVVVISGASSGIGLATACLLLKLGAKVILGDIATPPEDVLQNENATYIKVDVTIWKDLCTLFRKAKEQHGRVDHAFCNAGITGPTDFFEDGVDEDGDPLPLKTLTFDVNLMGVVGMTKLAIWYMSKQEDGGSIVLNASAACISAFGLPAYTASKHGVLGIMRGLSPILNAQKSPIRINTLSPSWTDSKIISRDVLEAVGCAVQSPDVVARSASLLMADASRQGELLYSDDGKITEIEGAILQATKAAMGGATPGEDLLRCMEKLEADKACL